MRAAFGSIGKVWTAAVFAVVVMAVGAGAQTWDCGKPASGTTPTNAVTATLSNGTLTISGSGAMADYTNDGYNFAPWNDSKSSITSVVIGDGVTSVGLSAFRGCTNLTSVTIPNSVVSIGGWAFEGCTSLISVAIPNTVTTISNHTFDGCTGLASVTIPNSVTNIAAWAFYGCTGLTSVTIPNKVASIGSQAFYDCKSLMSVTIGNSVTSIGFEAFYNCTSLMSIISLAESPPSIDERTFYIIPCLLVPEVSVNAYKDANEWKSFTCIQAFPQQWDCGVTPGTVTAVLSEDGTLTVSGVGAMKDYNDDDAPWYAFRGFITRAVIGDGVTSIGRMVFYRCKSLTSMTISNSVTDIGFYAFGGCTGLTSVTIPNSVTSIEIGAFSSCTGLTSVTIPNSVTSIGGSAFSGCTGLTSVTIPNSVTSIEGSTFSGCTSLMSVTIPNSVTSIGYDAFRGCTGLTSVTIPSSVTSIGDYAFGDCADLTSVTSLSVVPPVPDFTGGHEFADVPLGSACLYVPPSAIDAYSTADVWKIFGCIQAITDAITVTFESQGSVVGLQYVLSGDIVSKPAYPARSGHVFDGWYKDDECTVPWDFRTDVVTLDITLYAKWLQDDDVQATWDCGVIPGTVMAKLSYGGTLTISGIGAMAGYSSTSAPWLGSGSSITNVIIEEGVTSIGNSAFYFCTGLTSVTIPNSVATIGVYAFYYCASLTAVTIPNSVTSIGQNVFTNCYGLTSIISLSVIPPSTIGSVSTNTTACLYVPQTAIAAYQSNSDWNGFSCIQAVEGETIYDPTGIWEMIIFGERVTITITGDHWFFDGPEAFDADDDGTFTENGNVATLYSNYWQTTIGTATFTSNTTMALTLVSPNVVTGTFNMTKITPVTYTVTFNANGGSPTPAAQNVADGGYISAPVTVTKGTDIFGGWFTDNTWTTPWNFTAGRVTAPVNLIAKWTPTQVPPSTYAVAVVGGTGSGNFTANAVVSITATVPPGQRFVRWTATGVTLAAPNSATITFTMPANAVTVMAVYENIPSGILGSDRVIPQANPSEEAAVIAPAVILSGEFTVGPNPVGRELGAVNFFRQGKRVENAELRIYDATGNVVGKVKINDKALGSQVRRQVGSWDLRDKSGRLVSEGAYLVKGVLKVSDGKKEKVSVIVGVR